MSISWIFNAATCFVAIVGLSVGCGRLSDEPERAILEGEVTYDGKPVAHGEIRFIPTKGTKGPVYIEEIIDGRYRAQARGGVPVAIHRVEIRGFFPDPKYKGQEKNIPPMMTAADWPPKVQYLPAKYNANSTLEVVVQSGKGETTNDFVLAK